MGSPSLRDSPFQLSLISPRLTHGVHHHSGPPDSIGTGLKLTVYRARFEFPPPTAGSSNINLPDPQNHVKLHNSPPEAILGWYLELQYHLTTVMSVMSSFRLSLACLADDKSDGIFSRIREADCQFAQSETISLSLCLAIELNQRLAAALG